MNYQSTSFYSWILSNESIHGSEKVSLLHCKNKIVKITNLVVSTVARI